MQGKVKGEGGVGGGGDGIQGRQKKRSKDNIREWIGLEFAKSQRVDRPGVRQVAEGIGEQRQMEETGCEIICGAQTTLTVKG